MKQLRTYILLIALSCLFHEARAQFVVAKVGGGLASAYGSVRAVGAYKAGVAYEYEIGGNWSLEGGLFYNGKGYKEKDKTVSIFDDAGVPVLDDNGNQRTGKMNRTVNAQYISLPVVFHYYCELTPQKYLVFTAGPYAAYGVGGKDKTKGDASLSDYKRYYSDRNTFSVSGTKRFDLGLEVGLGYQWTQALTVAAEADFGMLRMRPSRRNLSAMLTLSYRFRTDE